VRDLSNLGWPETPFGSVTSPVQNPATWLTGLSLMWGDAGGEPVIMGAAAVFWKIHRTRRTAVSEPLVHYGYRVLVPEALGENHAIVTALDTLLVQARRQARIIAWHNAGDDLHLLLREIDGLGGNRCPGIVSISEAWKDRSGREKGTALCVDTARDLGPYGLLSDTAAAHHLHTPEQYAGGQQQDAAQAACEDLVTSQLGDSASAELVVSVLSSAVMTTLLGGLATERLDWATPLSTAALLERVAWDVAPSVLGNVSTIGSQ
jgi:hypothetical protein